MLRTQLLSGAHTAEGTEGTAGICGWRRRACPRIWRSRSLLRNFRFVLRVTDRRSRLEGIYLEERTARPRDIHGQLALLHTLQSTPRLRVRCNPLGHEG